MLSVILAMLAAGPSAAAPQLSVQLRLVAGHAVELTVQNLRAQAFDAEVSSAFMLLPIDSSEEAVPNRRLWAPAHPGTGRPYDRAVRVCQEGIQPPPDPEPQLSLKPGESHTIVVDLDTLKWQLAHLSVWPDQALADTVEAGEYFLWFELDGREHVRSNRVRIDLKWSGRPTMR
jgi:hypothetical protein